ncbi:hypothetical protein [Oceanobacillus manasiensis]|uniref:hypothetical protein n=1 Tax=Oceanobacillus manasiensis TaxID=586413 RepID=UPI000A972268|nr:hypothetical protein [Oceanobacillus manasiensis]
MENQSVEKLLTNIEELKTNIDEQIATKLDIETCKRIVTRLNSFSAECEECEKRFIELEGHIMQLLKKKNSLTEDDIKHYTQKVNNITSHLTKKHKLVTSGFYFSVCMPIGTSLGVVFGLLIFENIGLGLPLGIGLGVAIGAALDAKAKKDGLTL